jgi:hypothetical protein
VLALALALALIQATVPLWGARTNDATLMGVAGSAALARFAFAAASFGALRGAVRRPFLFSDPALPSKGQLAASSTRPLTAMGCRLWVRPTASKIADT